MENEPRKAVEYITVLSGATERNPIQQQWMGQTFIAEETLVNGRYEA